ncbi:hypothetical protein SNEBB_006570 [Seison nebaliae]|nr:hypothetical protein SNEBB_006570 [Seison nebaliae]
MTFIDELPLYVEEDLEELINRYVNDEKVCHVLLYSTVAHEYRKVISSTFHKFNDRQQKKSENFLLFSTSIQTDVGNQKVIGCIEKNRYFSMNDVNGNYMMNKRKTQPIYRPKHLRCDDVDELCKMFKEHITINNNQDDRLKLNKEQRNNLLKTLTELFPSVPSAIPINQIQIHVPLNHNNYPAYRDLEHILEISQFSPKTTEPELIKMIREETKHLEFRIVWVDDTHALVVLDSKETAKQLLKNIYSTFRFTRLENGINYSRIKARTINDSLNPYKRKPKQNTETAVRLINKALNINSLSDEQRNQLKKEKENRQKKKHLQMKSN